MTERTTDIKATSRGKSEELLQLVSFNIGEEEFGVDILNVQEINRMMDVTRVPNSRQYVEGVINLRGKVIPIVDLRRQLGLQRKEHDKHTRIVVVEVDRKVVGFIVDGVSEVLRIPKEVTEPPPTNDNGGDEGFITSIGKLEGRLLILLNVGSLMRAAEPALRAA